ncbi:hypothetical protein [Streptomyces sp. NPDC086777]|uniref:hypothetical protein n=1 Tax=Streptomyces sp. NPDC086777 TaxID=3154866 RepID=UPI00344F3F98
MATTDSTRKGVNTLKIFIKGKTQLVRTTIDASLQAVAWSAVLDTHLQAKPADTVALPEERSRPGCRALRRRRRHRHQQHQFARSTMKIIPSAL